MIIKKLILFLIFLVISPTKIYAATWEVSPTGTYKTITSAINAAGVGDTVSVHNGIYVERVYITKSGLKLLAVAGESPVIDGQNSLAVIDGNSNNGLVEIAPGADNVTVSGLEIKNSAGRGISSRSNNNLIFGNKVHEIYGIGLNQSNGTGTEFRNNEVWHTVLSNAIDSVCGTTANSWFAALDSYGTAANLKWIGNNVRDNCGEGLTMTSGDQAIGNTFKDNWSVDVYIDQAVGAVIDGNLISESEDNYVSGRSLANGIAVADEQSCVSSDNIIKNNLIIGTRNGFNFYQYQSCSGVKNTDIVNNTIVNSWDNGLRIMSGAHQNSLMANNIIYSPRGQAIYLGTQTGLIVSNNLLSDPLFTDTVTYKLSSNSPAIDNGIVTRADTDYLGIKRPQGTAYDIGAYEYKSTTDIFDLRRFLAQFTNVFGYNLLMASFGQ